MKTGRKGKYEEWLTDDSLLRIEGWARSGLTDEQICKNIGIHVATLCEWKNRFPQLNEALKRGKKPVDDEVENMLLKSALGFEYEETVTEIVEVPTGKIDENGKPIMRQNKQIRKIRKYSPPSNTAQIFWLKNRRPERWRDKQEVTGNINFANGSEALQEAFEKMKQGLDDE